MEKKRVDFCTVNLSRKSESGLTLNEYVLISITCQLLENGWCGISKSYYADILNISRQSVSNIINKLINDGWLEKDSQTKFIRATNKWYSIGEHNGSL